MARPNAELRPVPGYPRGVGTPVSRREGKGCGGRAVGDHGGRGRRVRRESNASKAMMARLGRGSEPSTQPGRLDPASSAAEALR